MKAFLFDTAHATDELIKAGFTQDQARRMVQIASYAARDALLTKTDFDIVVLRGSAF